MKPVDKLSHRNQLTDENIPSVLPLAAKSFMPGLKLPHR
jgi:hypothetical protein